MPKKTKPRKIQPLDHQLVNVETPDRGIGRGTMSLMLSHPTRGEVEVREDIKAAWAKQEEEEWESDDILESKLQEMGYIVHDYYALWVEV